MHKTRVRKRAYESECVVMGWVIECFGLVSLLGFTLWCALQSVFNGYIPYDIIVKNVFGRNWFTTRRATTTTSRGATTTSACTHGVDEKRLKTRASTRRVRDEKMYIEWVTDKGGGWGWERDISREREGSRCTVHMYNVQGRYMQWATDNEDDDIDYLDHAEGG